MFGVEFFLRISTFPPPRVSLYRIVFHITRTVVRLYLYMLYARLKKCYNIEIVVALEFACALALCDKRFYHRRVTPNGNDSLFEK